MIRDLDQMIRSLLKQRLILRALRNHSIWRTLKVLRIDSLISAVRMGRKVSGVVYSIYWALLRKYIKAFPNWPPLKKVSWLQGPADNFYPGAHPYELMKCIQDNNG